MRSRAAVEGDLGLVTVDALLQLAARATAPVVCRFDRPDATIDVLLRDGHVAWARRTSSLPDPRRASLREGSRALLRRTSEELVCELLAWTRGTFALHPAAELLPAELEEVDLALHLDHLLLEGMRRLDEHTRGEVQGLPH